MSDSAPKSAPHPTWLVRDARNDAFEAKHKSVLFALASRMNLVGEEAWPEESTLAGDAGMGVTKLKEALHALVTWGIVKKTVLPTATGRRNRYTIDFAQLAVTEKRAPVASKKAWGGSVTRASDPSDTSEGSVTRPTDGSVTRPTDGSVTRPTDGSVTRVASKEQGEGTSRSHKEKVPAAPPASVVETVTMEPEADAAPTTAPSPALISTVSETKPVKKPPMPRKGKQGHLLVVGASTAPRAPKANHYLAAFCAGQIDASGQPFALLKWSELDLVRAVKSLAPDLHGDDVTAWIRRESAAYRRAKPSDAKYGGFTPDGLIKWINASRPNEGAPPPSPTVYQPLIAPPPPSLLDTPSTGQPGPTIGPRRALGSRPLAPRPSSTA